MTPEPEGLFELRRARNHTVIVLVSVVDRRIVPALHLVSRLGGSDLRALHLSVDGEQTRRLAAEWMDLGLSWLPLHIEDATAQHLPASIQRAVERAVERAVAGTLRTTVVVPEADLARGWQRVLHRGNARRIAQQLQQIPGVVTVVVPVATP